MKEMKDDLKFHQQQNPTVYDVCIWQKEIGDYPKGIQIVSSVWAHAKGAVTRNQSEKEMRFRKQRNQDQPSKWGQLEN